MRVARTCVARAPIRATSSQPRMSSLLKYTLALIQILGQKRDCSQAENFAEDGFDLESLKCKHDIGPEKLSGRRPSRFS